MPQPKAPSVTSDPTKRALDATGVIREALQCLIDDADIPGIEHVLRELAPALPISQDSLSPVLDHARTCLKEQRFRLTNDLREIAEAKRCEVQCRLPYASIGCVTLREQHRDEWSLSVFDDVVLQTIRTANGRRLAEQALRIIDDIDAVMAQASAFAKDLRAARDALRSTNNDPVPANLLMLLFSHRRTLRSLLTSARDVAPSRGLSRAEFGFLLRRLADENSDPKTGLALTFSGATQHDTKQPEHYISVPDSPHPRRSVGHRRVAAVTISLS